jgi:hypothetical protein
VKLGEPVVGLEFGRIRHGRPGILAPEAAVLDASISLPATLKM